MSAISDYESESDSSYLTKRVKKGKKREELSETPVVNTTKYEQIILELQQKIRDMSNDHPICRWNTYGNGNHCKKNISYNANGTPSFFCKLHQKLIVDYKITNSPKDRNSPNDDELCDFYTDIKVTPRSYKHIKYVMNKMGNEDNLVDVYLQGGLVEEADLSDEQYITTMSDDHQFYYNPKRGQSKAKNLKVMLRNHCQNSSTVSVDGKTYCEECYCKMKNVPKVSVIKLIK